MQVTMSLLGIWKLEPPPLHLIITWYIFTPRPLEKKVLAYHIQEEKGI